MRVPARLTGITKGKWFSLVWIVSIALVLLLAGVLVAKWLRELPNVQSFIEQFPGESELPANAAVGFLAWLAWQHFLNAFLVLLIIRSGWQIRTTLGLRRSGPGTTMACSAPNTLRAKSA